MNLTACTLVSLIRSNHFRELSSERSSAKSCDGLLDAGIRVASVLVSTHLGNTGHLERRRAMEVLVGDGRGPDVDCILFPLEDARDALD